MPFLRTKSELIDKENLLEIEDLHNSVQRTSLLRAEKLTFLRREHALIVRKIVRLKEQMKHYIQQTAILPEETPIDTVIPVFYASEDDYEKSLLGSNKEDNLSNMVNNPTDAILNYVRDTLRSFIPEIDRTLRDYNYRLRKLALREQKIKEEVKKIVTTEPVSFEDSYVLARFN